MNGTSDNVNVYGLAPNSTASREALEQMKAGLCTEVEGLRKQIQGKTRLISGLNKLLSQTHGDTSG